MEILLTWLDDSGIRVELVCIPLVIENTSSNKNMMIFSELSTHRNGQMAQNLWHLVPYTASMGDFACISTAVTLDAILILSICIDVQYVCSMGTILVNLFKRLQN